jgi:hypothetical protein
VSLAPLVTRSSRDLVTVAHNLIALGPVPAGEAPASVGERGYAEREFLQCQRFIDLLRRTIGPEPAGAKLRVRRSGKELDPYLEVVVEYDDENRGARAYAIRCDREAPTRWDQEVLSMPQNSGK